MKSWSRQVGVWAGRRLFFGGEAFSEGREVGNPFAVAAGVGRGQGGVFFGGACTGFRRLWRGEVNGHSNPALSISLSTAFIIGLNELASH